MTHDLYIGVDPQAKVVNNQYEVLGIWFEICFFISGFHSKWNRCRCVYNMYFHQCNKSCLLQATCTPALVSLTIGDASAEDICCFAKLQLSANVMDGFLVLFWISSREFGWRSGEVLC